MDRVEISVVRELAEMIVNKDEWAHEDLVFLKQIVQAEMRNGLRRLEGEQ